MQQFFPRNPVRTPAMRAIRVVMAQVFCEYIVQGSMYSIFAQSEWLMAMAASDLHRNIAPYLTKFNSI
jgi:hypothetical protein